MYGSWGRRWKPPGGDFRFNVYVLAGMLGAVLACLVTGWAGTYCLSLSLLLAFALLYPEMQVLLFFVIPIKVKYFGIFSAAVWVLGFLSADWMTRLNYLLSMGGVHPVLCPPASVPASGPGTAGAVAPPEPPLRGAAP